MSSFKDFLVEEMKDPEFAAEYPKVLAEEKARCAQLIELERAVITAAEEWRAYEKKGTRWHTVRLQKLASLRKAVDDLRRARGEGGE